MSKSLVVGLVGNPNAGKSTVFNALTGARQHIGNWPGVTVERKSGTFTLKDQTVEVIDLPGTYSLSAAGSIDECIAHNFILNSEADIIINILDASQLERHLYLTLQLLEMRIPIIIALNMMDVAKQKELQILHPVLEQYLGCQVIPLQAHQGKGMRKLKEAVLNLQTPQAFVPRVTYPPQIAAQLVDSNPPWQTLQRLENEMPNADILIAESRYHFIETLLQHCQIKPSLPVTTWTARIDNVVLNRFLGLPIFLMVMYSMFLFAINIGGAFQDFFDIGSDTIFVRGLAYGLTNLNVPGWLIAFLANGIGKGINTIVTFIPVIAAMFLFLAFLEDSGYMARAAFVVDRLMRALGLPGKSFVPMIIGFGCNVPSVMAARTLENPRDRILTVMMSPFMSCGARLAIFAVFTAAFFPTGGQNIVFILYLIGIAAAMLTGLLLRKTLLQGDPSPLVMELPIYHMPRLPVLIRHAWQRLKSFLWRAGKLIIPICVLIGMLNSLNIDGTLNYGEGDTRSLLSQLGHVFTPIFAPMGIAQDNWPATVGLLTGVLAKEVVIGSLNTLYSQAGHLAIQVGAFDFWGGLQSAAASIVTNLSQLGSSLGNPVLAKAPVHTLNQEVYGVMYQRFNGQIGAMAYLLFVLLYFPCVSTTAAMVRELNRGWTWFSILWTTGIAYVVAVVFYQAATFLQHPVSSFYWIVGMLSLVVCVVVGIKIAAQKIPKNLVLNSLSGCGSTCQTPCKQSILNTSNP